MELDDLAALEELDGTDIGGEAVAGGDLIAGAEPERVQALLGRKNLEQYSAAIVEQGYSFVDDLLEADDEDIAQLAKDVRMKKPEAKRFLKAVEARKTAPPPPKAEDIEGVGGPSEGLQAKKKKGFGMRIEMPRNPVVRLGKTPENLERDRNRRNGQRQER